MTESADRHKKLYSERIPKKIKATCHYLEAYIENIDRSPELREARAIRRLWENCTMSVYPYELVAGRAEYIEPVFFHIGTSTYINEGALGVLKEQGASDAYLEEIKNKINSVREKKYMCYFDEGFKSLHPGIYNDAQMLSMESNAASSTFFGGHMVLDYEFALSRGLDAYAKDIEKYRENTKPVNPEFYEAMSTILEAFRTFILRTSDACADAANAASDSGEKANMLSLAADLEWIAHHPPETFRQALQLVWIMHICGSSDTFGRFDKYLYPFYQHDMENGTMTSDDALALLESLMIKIEEADSIQNMTIGGILPDGSLCYNDLTKLILSAVRNMGYKGPNLCLRINPEMPDEYWGEITESLSTGQGLPALYSDKVMIGYLIKLGISLKEANDYCLAGCSQVMIPGRSQFVNDIGMMNAAKILEITYYNGVDRTLSGKKCGLETGEASGFASFDEFLSAYKKQLSYFAVLEAEINNADVILRRDTEGYTLRSLFTRDCLENGKGVFYGGARYNNVQLEVMGLTNAADSLAGIKQAVFDEKIISFEELTKALENNFEGYESLRAYLKNKVPKFGNDIAWVDEIRADITNHLFAELRRQRGVPGGIYIPGEVIFVAHEPCGWCTGAMPDGRKSHEVLADSAGASQGCDSKGPTALMNSVLKIPVDEAVTSVVLNLKFVKKYWDNEKAKGLLKTFFLRGGQQVQINVCDSEVLKKAYEKPEQYRSLVIRVGGYSAYFTQLSKVLQKEIIERTENVI